MGRVMNGPPALVRLHPYTDARFAGGQETMLPLPGTPGRGRGRGASGVANRTTSDSSRTLPLPPALSPGYVGEGGRGLRHWRAPSAFRHFDQRPDGPAFHGPGVGVVELEDIFADDHAFRAHDQRQRLFE